MKVEMPKMRKKLDEKIKKKIEKLYAYNINRSGNNALKKQDIAFKNLEKDFYEDIINSDLNIKKSTKSLEGIKDKTIKESVYTNKNIPDIWKTKLTYRQEVHDAISNDENFAKYVGTKNEEEKVDFEFDNKLQHFSQTNYNNNLTSEKNKSRNYFLGLNNVSKTIGDNDSISKKNECFTERSETRKPTKRKFFSTLIQPTINDKFIASKLDEYRIKYNMNNFMTDIRHKRVLEGKDKDLKEMPNFLKIRKGNYGNYLKSLIENEKAKVLGEKIFVNLLPPKNRLDDIDIEKNKLKKHKMEIPNKIKFLVSSSPEYDNPPKITNPSVRRDLELIDYYGPLYVHCKYCHRRNLEFYENSEVNQCLQLTNYLKKVRLGRDKDDDEENKKKEKK